MDLAAFIARPGPREIHPELHARRRDFTLGHRDKRPEQFHPRIGAQPHRLAHRLHEIFPAIRIDRVVTPVRRDHESFRADTLRKPTGDRQHDRVPKRYDRQLHVFRLVVPLRDFAPALQ